MVTSFFCFADAEQSSFGMQRNAGVGLERRCGLEEKMKEA
jgi:hypothetical protein